MFKYRAEIIEKANKIKVVIFDVDGVLTDGGLIYDSYGRQLKNFNVNDGFGIYLLRQSGIKCVILTAKASSVVRKRAKELKIDKVYQNFHYKIQVYDKIQRTFKVSDSEICFIGDDIIDIPILKRVGLAVSPANAMDEVKSVVDVCIKKRGGQGAVRELCELILKSQGTWKRVTSRYFE